MYSLVLRQLNPMQKGIQSLHAVVEYANYIQSGSKFDPSLKQNYKEWSDYDKTMIVLDSGTSDDLFEDRQILAELGVFNVAFNEPDLYNMPTAVCFILDERVWDTKNYPDYQQYLENWKIKSYGHPMSYIPTEDVWIKNTFNGIDPTNILKIRNFIFSKRLSQ